LENNTLQQLAQEKFMATLDVKIKENFGYVFCAETEKKHGCFLALKTGKNYG